MHGLQKNMKNLHFWAFWATMANFGPFLTKRGKTGIFSKKRLEHFCRAYKPELTTKFQKKVMDGFRETSLRTDEQTKGRESLGLQRLLRETNNCINCINVKL